MQPCGLPLNIVFLALPHMWVTPVQTLIGAASDGASQHHQELV